MNWLLRRLVNSYPLLRGRWRVFNFAQKRVSGILLAQDSEGTRFLLDLDGCIDANIYLGNYENEVIKELCRQIVANRCKTFIDIGAHIGFYAFADGETEANRNDLRL